MSRYHVEWTERFSDYLDGDVGAADREEIERHLAECGACREVLAELQEVVARAGALPERQPPDDLWQGIAAAIGGPGHGTARPGQTTVIELPSARARNPHVAPGRLRRSVGLVAAAAALVAVSVASTLWVANARPAASDAQPTVGVFTDDPLRAVDTGTPPPALASELATLEDVLRAARGALDPNTVRVLERNLDVIERAIADSREALALDPGNAFLAEHLERMYRRKLVYLQDAVRVAQWSG